MQHIGAFTKIHGSGNIEVVVDDIVDKELMRQREAERKEFGHQCNLLKEELQMEKKKHEMEMRCMNLFMDGLKNQRNKQRKESFDALEAFLCYKEKRRILNLIENIYGLCFACILVLLMWAKFIEYGCYDEDGEWHNHSVVK